MRTVVGRQRRYVEVDVNRVGQLRHYGVAYLLPCAPFETHLRHAAAAEHGHAFRFAYHAVFRRREVAHSHVHYRPESLYRLRGVAYDRRARVFESFVAALHAAAGVDMQQPEPVFAFGRRAQCAVYGRLVASDQSRDFTLLDPSAHLRADVVVHRAALLVDAALLAGVIIFGQTAHKAAAFLLAGAQTLHVLTQILRYLLYGVVDVGRGDALAPLVGREWIVQIHAHRLLDHGVGSV